jgi:hypothetical protein
MRHIPASRQTDGLGLFVRNLYEGRLSAHASVAAAPTSGANAQGDIIRDSNPVKVTGGAFNYVRIGWICTAGGEPGTWEELRIPCA